MCGLRDDYGTRQGVICMMVGIFWWTRSMVHGPLEAQSTMDHPAAQTGGHRSEVARSPELGL
jgi:hypothetical protein